MGVHYRSALENRDIREVMSHSLVGKRANFKCGLPGLKIPAPQLVLDSDLISLSPCFLIYKIG